MPQLKDKILNRLGVADAMGHRAQETARRLRKAAHRHHDASNQDLVELARQIQERGVGTDEDLEERYCRGLVTRAHMIQAGHLAERDAARMPELDQSHFAKALAKQRGIYLIRHAKTRMNREDPHEDYVRGCMDIPLTEDGIREAHQIAKAAKPLGIQFILSSNLSRAADTAKIISRVTGAPVVQVSEAFRPWNMGRLQGRKVDDVRDDLDMYVRRFPGRKVPGGESFDEFKAQFLGALSHLLEAYDDRALPTLAVVTHSRNLKLVEAWLKDGGHVDEVDPDTYLKRDAPSPGGIVRLSPAEDGWQFEELEEPYLEKALPETKVKVKVKGQGGQPDVKVKVKIKPSDDQDQDEEEKDPEVKVEKAVRLSSKPQPGQVGMDFDEEAHPRAAEGTSGQYKPGEFVPKGEQQSGAEKPDHEKEPWELRLSDMPSEKKMDEKERSHYFDEQGTKIASSREKPQEVDDTPIGTWRKSDYFKGSHGTEVEQLRELDPNDLIPSEDTGPERQADVERYAQWAKEGRQAPPIHVVETDNGKMKVTNGHRRWLAAKKAGTKVRAWVSPTANIPGMVDSQGRPMKTGITHELSIHHAIEAGHRVPDEVLADYPDLKAKHDQQRKETLRQAGQEAEEDGHPGMAEAHQELDPKEDWEKNGVHSKAFKAWFGDSKVTNPDGTPMVVYHGSTEKFDQFDPKKQLSTTSNADYGVGFYFSPRREIAEEYAQTQDPNTGRVTDKGHIYPVHLSIQNPWPAEEPFTLSEWRQVWNALPPNGVLRTDAAYLKKNVENTIKSGVAAVGKKGLVFQYFPGHIPIHLRNQGWREVQEALEKLGYDGVQGNGEWVAWKPEQIKHVESEGFDPEDPRIKKAVRGRPFVPPDVPRWRGEKPSPDSYLPLNGVEDREKFRAMAREMADGKWQWTVPLVRCGDQLITGSHRYAAARVVGTPLEVKDLDDIFKESGLDFRSVWEANAQPFVGWLSNMDFALNHLPAEIRARYGIDLG